MLKIKLEQNLKIKFLMFYEIFKFNKTKKILNIFMIMNEMCAPLKSLHDLFIG